MVFTQHSTNQHQVKNKHMAQNNPKPSSIKKLTSMVHTLLINLSQMKKQSTKNNKLNLNKTAKNNTTNTLSNSTTTIHTINLQTLMINSHLKKKKTVSINFMNRTLTLIKILKVIGTLLRNKDIKFNPMKSDVMRELKNLDNMTLKKTLISIKGIEVTLKKTFLTVGARTLEASINRCLISKTLIKNLDKLTTLMLNLRMLRSGLILRLMNQ